MDVSAQLPAPYVPLEQLWSIAPPILRETLPLGGWRIDLLWRLRLPVQRVPIADLDWLLDLPVWQAYGRHFAVSPRQVLDDPERFAHQHTRSMACDLTFPLHLCQWKAATVILDGFHRLLKAVILGRGTLPAMVLSTEDFAAVCVSPPD